MKKALPFIIIAAIVACGITFAAKRWQESQNHAKYERTVKSLLHYANEICKGHRTMPPEHDAWGAEFTVETNAMSIIYTSHGADVTEASDNIVLRLKHDFNSYSISYIYDSYHYSSAVIVE